MCRSSGNLLWQIFIIMILFGANESFIHFWETWCDCNPRVFNWEIMIGRGFKNVQIYFGENVMNRFLPFLHVLVFTYTCVENLFALKTIVLEKPSKLRFIFKLRTIFKRSSNLFLFFKTMGFSQDCVWFGFLNSFVSFHSLSNCCNLTC